MATNLQIDDKLIVESVQLGHHRTKKAAVTRALEKYIQHLQQQRVLDLFGKVDYDRRYDYKKQRART